MIYHLFYVILFFIFIQFYELLSFTRVDYEYHSFIILFFPFKIFLFIRLILTVFFNFKFFSYQVYLFFIFSQSNFFNLILVIHSFLISDPISFYFFILISLDFIFYFIN